MAFRSGRARSRGFSLTELLAVVAIIGVLGALGIARLGRDSRRSNVAHATVIVKSIGAAEEQYKAVNQVYLDVSTDGAWYPVSVIGPNQKRVFWGADSAATVRWRALGPDIRQLVQFVFKANAGLPTDPIPALPSGTLVAPDASIEPWYLIQARADADGDGKFCVVAGASWTPEVYVANDGD